MENKTWEKIKDVLVSCGKNKTSKYWLDQAKISSSSDNGLLVTVPSVFIKDSFEKKFGKTLKQELLNRGFSSDYEIVDVVAGTTNGEAVHVDIIELPKLIKLNNAYPNPFNPITTLSFELPFEQKVSIAIYDVTGREVASLVDGTIEAGYHFINWDAGNSASSLYFMRMKAGNFVDTQKLLLIK